MTDPQLEALRRHFGVVAAGLRHEIQVVVEGVAGLHERLASQREETAAG